MATEAVLVDDVYDGTDAFVELVDDGDVVNVQITFTNHLIDGGEFVLSLDLDALPRLDRTVTALKKVEGL